MESWPIPAYITAVCARLEQAGHAAYLVGGCVRDLLLDRRPRDWDLASAAAPEEVLALFPRSEATGLRHGTVTIHWGPGKAEHTTFRREGTYSDHRRPDRVDFVADLETDLSRRDFTINAMALRAGALTDPFGGRGDLERGLIRTVGDPERRFSEDALRMFRAYRFAGRFGFALQAETEAAIYRCAPWAEALARERVYGELCEILEGPGPDRFWDAADAGLLGSRLEHFAPPLPRPARSLRSLPRDCRWCAAGVWLTIAGCINAPETFFRSFRPPERLCRLWSESAAAVLSGVPETELDWKRFISQNGWDAARLSARVAAFLGQRGSLAVLRRIRRSGDCLFPRELALSGGDLAALGLRGPEIGAALRRLLDHVLEHPAENRRDRLLEWMEHWKQ